MSTPEDELTGGQPTEEELRAAYEAELKKIRVEHVLLEQIVTMVNLGMRRTGLAPGTEGERDPGQVKLAIEGVRALLPLVEQAAPPQAAPIRDALSQLQLAYVRIGGNAQAGESPGGPSKAGGAPAPDAGEQPSIPPPSRPRPRRKPASLGRPSAAAGSGCPVSSPAVLGQHRSGGAARAPTSGQSRRVLARLTRPNSRASARSDGWRPVCGCLAAQTRAPHSN